MPLKLLPLLSTTLLYALYYLISTLKFDVQIAPTSMRVRLLPSLHFNVPANGTVELCKEPPYSEACQLSSRWLENIAIVSNDLFMGRQFTRPKYISEKQPEPVSVPQAITVSQ